MVIARGAVTSILFAIGWLALVVSSRPHVAGVATNDAAARQGVAQLETWSFTPALLTRDERATYASERGPSRVSAMLANADAKIGTRLIESALLALAGVAMFWFGVLVFARSREVADETGAKAWARGLASGGSFMIVGPLLPCLIVEGPAGLLISGPSIACGLVIAAITLVSKRFAKPSS